MAESSSSGDEEFRAEAKYKQFSAAVERSLKGFELSSEWHDLISSLARLNKTLLAYKQYPAVPHQLLVSKRLSQCLHPNLPGGVHLKALDVYRAIFDRIGTKGLSENLLVYSSGLFPLLGHGSMSVRPSLLDIYERYYLAVGRGLIPCLPGMVLGLLPGLEDESEHTERITRLLDAICLATDEPSFYSALWQCVLCSDRARLPGTSYLLTKLNKKATAEDQSNYLGGNLPLMVSALCGALQDKSVLVSRTTLDVILTLFPLHRPFLLPSDLVLLLSSALVTLLRRDMSLNRRLYSWLLGTQTDKTYMETHFPEVTKGAVDQETAHTLYFDKFAKIHLLSALRSIIASASQATRHLAAISESVLPYRLLRSLMDKPEIGDSIVVDILPDLCTCLKIQVESLGGFSNEKTSVRAKTHGSKSSVKEGTSKKTGKKSHKVEVLQSANLFFNCLAPEQLWQWLESLLSKTIMTGAVGEGRAEGDKGSEGKEGDGKRRGSRESVCDDVGESPNSPVFPRSPMRLVMGAVSSACGGKTADRGVQLSCSAACKLIVFLLQVLPLKSMEDVYIHHMPHLCWHILHSLTSQEPLTIKPRSLQHCLELLLFATGRIFQEASLSSPATTPTTALCPEPVEGSALASHADKLKWKLLTQFSAFFSRFISSCMHHSSQPSQSPAVAAVGGLKQKLSESVGKCFVSGCHLLCLLTQVPLSPSLLTESKESSGTTWLPGMKWVCSGSHDHHVTFTALETLFTLLSHDNCSKARSGLTRTTVSVLCPDISSITRDSSFIESVTRFLWGSLSASLSDLHVEASSLLCWTHTLCPGHTCETTLLQEFTTEAIDVYQRFAVLWQHSPDNIHGSPCRLFSRAQLRMVEGLQSKDLATRGLVGSWVHSATSRGQLHSLVAPLVWIIMEQDRKRKAAGHPSDNGMKEDAGKYYYSPSHPTAPSERERAQEEEMRLHYTQVLDSDQVLYALSLLQAVLSVHPISVITSLATSLVNPPTYGDSATDQSASVTAQKSLMEVILLSLTSFTRSEYSPSVDVTLTNVVENLRVKSTSVEMIGFLLHQFSVILSSSSSEQPASTAVGGTTSGSRGIVHNPSYVSALVTLCDIQKVLLLTLSQVVRNLRQIAATAKHSCEGWSRAGPPVEASNKTVEDALSCKGVQVGQIPSVPLQVLYVNLLRCLHNLISVETQCIPSSPAAMTPGSKHTKKPLSSADTLVHPGLSTVSQPFFQSLVIDTLADRSLSPLHPHLLHMFSATLPHLSAQLDHLAPKILRQLCQNLEATVTDSKSGSREASRETLKSNGASSGGTAVVSNVQALVNIVLCCLFGEFPLQSVSLKHSSLNQFWDVGCVSRSDESEEVSTPTSKQPSTMSWLLGVFAGGGQNKPAPLPVGGRSPKLGLSQGKVGRSIRLLLPAVYNALTEVWTWFSGRVARSSEREGVIRGGDDRSRGREGGETGKSMEGGGWLDSEKRRAEYEDVESLVLGLLGSLASCEPSIFFSSISTVWLEWDLDSKVNPNSKKTSKRKDAFIIMLHHIKVLPLEQFIRSVQFSFSDLARDKEPESSSLKQKYLLHFLYKYISSPLQSWEELAGCHSVMVLLIRDCYTQCYNGTSESLLNNCHLLCMLTSILHVYICRVPGLEKRGKKERKELQDLTLKLCEVLSSAAGYSLPSSSSSQDPPPSPSSPLAPPPPSNTNNTSARYSQAASDGFEIVENSELRTLQKKQPPKVLDGGPKSETDKNSLVPKATGEGRAGPQHSAPPSPVHTPTSEDKVTTAGHVRSSITASQQPHGSTVARRPQRNAADSSVSPGAQALAVLASTVSHFIDGVFGSSEKEKILALLKVVLHNIWPHLQNHSLEMQKLYHSSVKLLSSLSGFQATRKAWRRETFDLFMANNFFIMKFESLQEWKVLVDNLMTQDKTTFRDLLTRLAPPGLAPGLSNIFTTPEQEALNTARIVKRMAFAIFSAETDQYTSYLPDIQEKLSDCLKLQRHPLVTSDVFLGFRTILLRFSPTHLLSFWPAIISETLSGLQEMEGDLAQELREKKTVSSPSQLTLYLSLAKLLHTASSLPYSFLPHFQYLQWGFSDVGSSPHSMSTSSCLGTGPVFRICTLFSSVERKERDDSVAGSLPHLRRITSIQELAPFFTSLTPHHPWNFHQTHTTPGDTPIHAHHISSSHQQMALVSGAEKDLLRDFLEPFSS